MRSLIQVPPSVNELPQKVAKAVAFRTLRKPLSPAAIASDEPFAECFRNSAQQI